jgi:hypothetical protein
VIQEAWAGDVFDFAYVQFPEIGSVVELLYLDASKLPPPEAGIGSPSIPMPAAFEPLKLSGACGARSNDVENSVPSPVAPCSRGRGLPAMRREERFPRERQRQPAGRVPSPAQETGAYA